MRVQIDIEMGQVHALLLICGIPLPRLTAQNLAWHYGLTNKDYAA